jgi:hypothetical protein
MATIKLYGRLETTSLSLMDYLDGRVWGHPEFPDGSWIRVPDPTPLGNSLYRSSRGNVYELRSPSHDPCCELDGAGCQCSWDLSV